MYLPKLKHLPTLLRELLSQRTLQREPETSLVMVDTQEVQAFVDGSKSNALGATYLFINSHVSQVIHGRRRVLDLGCGPATILCQIAMTNPSINFIGVDLSDTMLEQGHKLIKELGLDNVTLMKADITDLSQFADKEFDGVISTFALHHLPTSGHLQNCFKEIHRVLEPGGAVFLIDFGRMKNIKSVIQMAYSDHEDDPYLLTLDKERSMRAAFTLQDFKNFTKDLLPKECRVHSTAQVPLLLMIRTAPGHISYALENQFKKNRRKLTARFRDMLDDIRFFFYLDGVTNDVFDPLVPVAGQIAKLKMLNFAMLPVIGGIHSSKILRSLGALRLAAKISVALIKYRVKSLFVKNEIELQEKLYQRLAKAFSGELGLLKGPLMKFGQMASYLTENIPPAVRDALQPLQHRSPPLEGKVIRKIVERELREPIAKIFKEWHDTPIAAASISQLHLARLPNDKLVVVKVRYPKILSAVRSDFFILKTLAPVLKNMCGLSNLRELIDELETLILAECDFLRAGDYQERFREIFRDDPELIFPKVYSDYSTAEVLTMDYIEGQSYEDFKKSSTQEEKNKAAIIIWRMAAQSINRYCLYNADPHPGNYLFVNGKVAFIDFGFTKRFSPAFMDLWKQQSLAGCEGDFERFKKINRQMGYEIPGKEFNHRALYDLYRNLIYRSWQFDRNFKFTKEFVNQELRELLDNFHSSPGAYRMPVEFVAILRLLWGHHSILADLQAEGNWHAAVYSLLKEPSQPALKP
jgi:arsenite methyltransferase